MLSEVRPWGLGGVLFWGSCQDPGVGYYSPSGRHNPEPPGPAGVQGDQNSAAPRLGLQCNMLPPLCKRIPSISSLLYLNLFTLIPLTCCDVKLWSHFRCLQHHFCSHFISINSGKCLNRLKIHDKCPSCFSLTVTSN